MQELKYLLIVVFLGLLFLESCSCEKEKRYSKTELLTIGQQVDSEMKDVLGEDINDVPANCKDQGGVLRDYIIECIRSYRIRVRSVVMVIVEFESHEDACKVARSIDQYCWNNWLFDDVSGEPVLEEFVENVYHAQRPFRKNK